MIWFHLSSSSPKKWNWWFCTKKKWLCCNLSGGVALIMWFTTDGMCVKNSTIIYVARASNNMRDCDHDLYCCLLPQCEALRTCRSGFPIVTWVKHRDRVVLEPLAATWEFQQTLQPWESEQQPDTHCRKTCCHLLHLRHWNRPLTQRYWTKRSKIACSPLDHPLYRCKFKQIRKWVRSIRVFL